jgi:hypothetical protein
VLIASRALDRLSGQDTVEKGRVRLSFGLALVADGRTTDGLRECRVAAECVQQGGSRFEAARMWREIAELETQLGLMEGAVESLRRMADCVGVRAPASVISGTGTHRTHTPSATVSAIAQSVLADQIGLM